MPSVAGSWWRRIRCAAGGVLVISSVSFATDVRVVAITPGRSADLLVDGGEITLEIGEQTPEGVKLLSADRDRAVVRVDGKTRTLSLTAARPGPAPEGGRGSVSGGATVTLAADARGHFTTSGFINGQPARLLVDTGATVTTLSTAYADRLGIDYENGAPTAAMTVNGMVGGWRVSLDSVRVGNVTVHDVDAVVVDNDALPVVLLGMTFLDQFDMQRQGGQLVLRRRR